MIPEKTLAERYWEKVVLPTEELSPGACWSWHGAHTRYGYGLINMHHRTIQAHRASWMLHHGPIPDGLCVLHKCDNPRCTNPGHLFLGTQLENIADRERKGRNVVPKGESSGNHKLTESDVIDIRTLHAMGARTRDLVAAYSEVYPSVIAKILARTAWAHVVGSVKPRRPRRQTGLTADDIIDIRTLRAFGARIMDLAREYGLSMCYTSSICNGRSAGPKSRIWTEAAA